MSNDHFSTTTGTSWFQRLGSAFGGMLAGLALLVVGVVLLVHNEGRSVQAIRTANEGGRNLVSAPADRIDPALEGRLVHVIAAMTAGAPLVDASTGVSAQGLRLARDVEHYQWIEESRSETRTKLGGGQETVTTYDYRQDWSRTPIDSSKFQRPDGHRNPAPVIETGGQAAQTARFGAYTVDENATGRLNATDRLSPTAAQAREASRLLGRPVSAAGDALYVGVNPATPRIGDARIRYTLAPEGDVSMVAGQSGDRLIPFAAKAGGRLFEVRAGHVSAEDIIQQVKAANQTLTWLLRLGGFAALFIGFSMILAPLKVLADVLPPVGAVIGFGVGALSLVLAALISGTVIALSWLAVRPVTAILALAAAAAISAGVIFLRKGRRAPVSNDA